MGQEIKGLKRHAIVDPDRRALKVQVHTPDIQNRKGIGPLVNASRNRRPIVSLRYADAGYQGLQATAACPSRLEIVRKLDGQVGFAVHSG